MAKVTVLEIRPILIPFFENCFRMLSLTKSMTDRSSIVRLDGVGMIRLHCLFHFDFNLLRLFSKTISMRCFTFESEII